MKKVLFIAALSVGFLFAGCSSDDNNDPQKPPMDNVDDIEDLPYSESTPEQQKAKLESEGEALLNMAKELQTSKSVAAYLNLGELFSISFPFYINNDDEDDTDEEGGTLEPAPIDPDYRSRAEVEDVFKYANYHAVYTWDATSEEWNETESNTELKFVFPSKKNSTTNDAEFIITATESDMLVNGYNLPASANGILKVAGTQVGTMALTATYKNDEVPVKANFSLKLEKYELSFTFDRNADKKASGSLTFDGKSMMEAGVESNVNLDKLFADMSHYSGPAEVSSYINVLENLVFTFSGDIMKYEESNNDFDPGSDENWIKDREYYNKFNARVKSASEERAAAFNNNMIVTLASREDGTKIASLIRKAEEDYSCNQRYFWNTTNNQWEYKYDSEPNPEAKIINYTENDYLKFNDNTLVEADVYFKGFTTFRQKWEQFLSAFK